MSSVKEEFAEPMKSEGEIASENRFTDLCKVFFMTFPFIFWYLVFFSLTYFFSLLFNLDIEGLGGSNQ